jgi:hypothetical protein
LNVVFEEVIVSLLPTALSEMALSLPTASFRVTNQKGQRNTSQISGICFRAVPNRACIAQNIIKYDTWINFIGRWFRSVQSRAVHARNFSRLEKKLLACMQHNRRAFTIMYYLPSACWSTGGMRAMVADKRMSARLAASYYLLFGLLAVQSGICRHRVLPRVRSRIRYHQSFCDLETTLSRTEFARVLQMNPLTFRL